MDNRFDGFTVDEILVLRAGLALITAHIADEAYAAGIPNFQGVMANALSDEIRTKHLEFAGVKI